MNTTRNIVEGNNLEKQGQILSERFPWVAVMASVIAPGLGQLYNGDVTKGLSVLMITKFTLPAASLLAVSMPAYLMVPLTTLASLIAVVAFVWDYVEAGRRATYLGKHYQLRSFNKVPYYFCFILATYTIFFHLHGNRTEKLIRIFKIVGSSMEPTMPSGDRFLANMSFNRLGRKGSIVRGDIVTFINPNDRTQAYVKRVIALPGDMVIEKNGEIILNGKQITDRDRHIETISGRKYQVDLPAKQIGNNVEHKLEVPDGHAFLLGDNREHSTDSIDFGPIPLRDVIGKVAQVLFSKRPGGSLRWSRTMLVPK